MKIGETIQPNVFVVLGMPRGGTSVACRGLKALGIDLGDNLSPVNHEWNPKGFWEDNEIVYKVNARVITALKISWESLQWFYSIDMNDDKLIPIKKFAADLLKQRFSNTQYWGFKDPNTVKILPFWADMFNQLQIKDHYLIALRNPLSCAQSYHKLTGIDVEHGLLLWFTHMMAAVEGTKGKHRIIVSYELLIKHPREQLERIKQILSISLQTNENEVDAYINGFLDNGLRHYQDSYEELLSHPAVAIIPVCIKMYDVLLRVAHDEIAFEDEAFTSTWLDIKNDFEKMFPIYSYINKLLQHTTDLKRTIRQVYKSRLWKITAPLRMIDEVFRARRKRLKQKSIETYER